MRLRVGGLVALIAVVLQELGLGHQTQIGAHLSVYTACGEDARTGGHTRHEPPARVRDAHFPSPAGTEATQHAATAQLQPDRAMRRQLGHEGRIAPGYPGRRLSAHRRFTTCLHLSCASPWPLRPRWRSQPALATPALANASTPSVTTQAQPRQPSSRGSTQRPSQHACKKSLGAAPTSEASGGSSPGPPMTPATKAVFAPLASSCRPIASARDVWCVTSDYANHPVGYRRTGTESPSQAISTARNRVASTGCSSSATFTAASMADSKPL